MTEKKAFFSARNDCRKGVEKASHVSRRPHPLQAIRFVVFVAYTQAVHIDVTDHFRNAATVWLADY